MKFVFQMETRGVRPCAEIGEVMRQAAAMIETMVTFEHRHLYDATGNELCEWDEDEAKKT